MAAPARGFTREQRTTIVYGILGFVVVLVVLQLWLLTATMNAFLGGDSAVVWPASSDAANYPDVSKSYRLAAEDVDGYLFPAGEAWLEAWRRDIAMPLYSDNLHPSQYGTYLAALTIFTGLYGRSSIGLPSRLTLNDGIGTTIWINPGDALVLQSAADAASGRYGRVP